MLKSYPIVQMEEIYHHIQVLIGGKLVMVVFAMEVAI